MLSSDDDVETFAVNILAKTSDHLLNGGMQAGAADGSDRGSGCGAGMGCAVRVCGHPGHEKKDT